MFERIYRSSVFSYNLSTLLCGRRPPRHLCRRPGAHRGDGGPLRFGRPPLQALRTAPGTAAAAAVENPTAAAQVLLDRLWPAIMPPSMHKHINYIYALS